MSPDEMVRLDQVTCRFGKGPPALQGVSGTIRAGQITGLVGPDGSGKSTLIRLMTGLLLPDQGALWVLGYDTRRDLRALHASIGYMPQRFGLYEDLTVEENLRLYADLRGLPPEDRSATFRQMLDFTGLAPFTGRLAGRLSGGMKQKLGLACALLRRPRLLLLDEPSVGVDPISRRELWGMVRQLAGEGVGVVWSTAYLDEAEACDHVLLLHQGQLRFAGRPSDLTDRVAGRVFRVVGFAGRPRPQLAATLDDPTILDGTIQGQSVRLVTATDAPPTEVVRRHFGPAARLAPTPPRFEDAFIDLLGGGPGGRSALAEAAAERPAGDTAPVIEARGLTKRFGHFTAARDIQLSIPRGEIFGLLGPNGAGKSTTFKMLCGLLKPTEGEGRVAGFDLRRHAAEARNRLGYMAQKFSLYGDLTIDQNLAFFAGAYGLRGAHKRRRIALLQEIFSFAPYGRLAAKDLPRGIQQRLALACAVMHEPDALFLDEPTSGVDPLTRREFWAHIHGLVEKGVTVLVTTHFMDEAEYCDRISLIYQGRSIALGSPDELKARVATEAHPDPTLEDAFVALVQRSEVEAGS